MAVGLGLVAHGRCGVGGGPAGARRFARFRATSSAADRAVSRPGKPLEAGARQPLAAPPGRRRARRRAARPGEALRPAPRDPRCLRPGDRVGCAARAGPGDREPGRLRGPRRQADGARGALFPAHALAVWGALAGSARGPGRRGRRAASPVRAGLRFRIARAGRLAPLLEQAEVGFDGPPRVAGCGRLAGRYGDGTGRRDRLGYVCLAARRAALCAGPHLDDLLGQGRGRRRPTDDRMAGARPLALDRGG